MIEKRQVSPVEVTRSVLAQIERLEPALNAYITVTQPEAVRAAEAAEKAIAGGTYLGAYHGIPVGIKDLYLTRGVATTGASKILANNVPDHDGTAVARLKRAGAVIVGKLNTHEFAYGGTTDSPYFGPTLNPWDRERTPGGSSGGSGAAVIAGMAIAATGSDTGGSIRIPSSYCGVAGIKPTYGRASRYGILPLAYSLDHPGPMTRTVKDSALMLTIISGSDPNDLSTVDLPVPDYARALTGDIKSLRFGIPKEHFFDHLDPEVDAAVRAAIKLLEDAGAGVEVVSLPNRKYALACELAIILAEATSIHDQWIQTRAADYAPDVRALTELGFFIPAADYVKAQRVRNLVRQDFEKAFQHVDAILTPTTPTPALLHGQQKVKIGDFEEGALDSVWRYTYTQNVTGLPAMSVPCGFTKAGLPIGLQIIGRAFDEETVLRVGHAFEARTEWHRRRPQV
jgi:aspartyl-tRNA(Asn)/glutamyl-tRNA(Gln) amidotransferase subunit A